MKRIAIKLIIWFSKATGAYYTNKLYKYKIRQINKLQKEIKLLNIEDDWEQNWSKLDDINSRLVKL